MRQSRPNRRFGDLLRFKDMKTKLLLLAALGLASCSQYDTTNATVYDYGPVEVDGCGWVVQVGNEVFKPSEELPTAFQVDSLEVEIKYKELETKAQCGLQPDAFKEIDIKSIE